MNSIITLGSKHLFFGRQLTFEANYCPEEEPSLRLVTESGRLLTLSQQATDSQQGSSSAFSEGINPFWGDWSQLEHDLFWLHPSLVQSGTDRCINSENMPPRALHSLSLYKALCLVLFVWEWVIIFPRSEWTLWDVHPYPAND
jgi:hypothetical protein